MLTCDVAVIGAGVFGSWTAWHLRRAGKQVLLADAWGPAHSRASSGDESRITRMSYGADEIYTRMSMRSLEQWRELFDRTAQPLFHRTGALRIGSDGDPYTVATQQALINAGVRIEIIGAAELAGCYPQMRLSNPRALGIFEPDSGAILARRAVAAVVRDAEAGGVRYVLQSIEPPVGKGLVASLRTASGETIHAGAFVFACGPWLPALFPELLAKRICPTRQEVFYFAPPAGDSRFSEAHLPVWLDITDPRCPYGFPDLESRGVRIAFDRHGEPFNPDTGDRTASAESVAQMREFLADRFPALRDAPLTETRVCQYENTSNGDFLIDRHPDFDNVWLAGGGSGHGFKHGPAVGEYVTALILGIGTPEPRFSLAAKSESHSRTVY
jgi:monomeric sarcosine oxidase